MPTLLDTTLLGETLQVLPGWEGGTEGIWRDVLLTPELDAELRRQVAVDAGAMKHPPKVESLETGTRFTLSTPGAGGVTELDIALASHINDLARRLTVPEPRSDA